MSEPMTATECIDIITEHGWFHRRDEVAAFIRTQSARVAELSEAADVNRLLRNRCQEFYEVEGIHPCDEVDRLRGRVAELVMQQKQAAELIYDLEEEARWRSCEHEPPEDYKNKPLLTREDFAGGYVYEVGFFASIWTGPFGDEIHPTEWRLIT